MITQVGTEQIANNEYINHRESEKCIWYNYFS